MGGWNGKVMEFRRVLLSWKWAAFHPRTPEGETGRRQGQSQLFPRTRQGGQPLWGYNTLKLDDFMIPPSPPSCLASSLGFFRSNLAQRVWEGPSFRGGTASPVWCNGKSQETWGPAACAVWPWAQPLTPLCLIVLISNMR